MTAGDLVVVLSAVLLTIGFAALIVVLLRVLDALRELRREVTELRSQTQPLIDDLRSTTDEARQTVDEARHDLERFDKVLGSAEAIGDAVGSRVSKTAFSSPSIKAASLARGTSRAFARLRRAPDDHRVRPSPRVIDVPRNAGERPAARRRTERRRKRA